MNNINKPDNPENLGGLERFWFAPVSYFYSISDAIDGIIQSVVFNTGKIWLECYCTAETIKFSELKKQDDNGDYFETKLSGWVPKDSPELLSQLIDMDQYQYIVKYKDNNGNYKLVGTMEEPINFTEGLDIPENVAGSNGRLITFFRSLRKRSLFHNNISQSHLDL